MRAVAVVTGASRGIGRAVAVELGRRGYRVGVGYRVQEAEARETAALLDDAFVFPIDLARADDVSRALGDIVSREGSVALLVNNAAIVSEALFTMSDAAEWREVVEVDLLGTASCCRAVARSMIAARRGAIVNVASTAALRVSPGHSAYASAKAGMLALTRVLAAELAPHGVRVNAVVPGLIDAGMGERVPAAARRRMLSGIPAGRAGTAEEVARAVAFLGSDDASYVMGAALVVDGGLTA